MRFILAIKSLLKSEGWLDHSLLLCTHSRKAKRDTTVLQLLHKYVCTCFPPPPSRHFSLATARRSVMLSPSRVASVANFARSNAVDHMLDARNYCPTFWFAQPQKHVRLLSLDRVWWWGNLVERAVKKERIFFCCPWKWCDYYGCVSVEIDDIWYSWQIVNRDMPIFLALYQYRPNIVFLLCAARGKGSEIDTQRQYFDAMWITYPHK